MDATEKCTIIREMADRLARAEHEAGAWVTEFALSETQCQRDRAREMASRAIEAKTALWRDFDETLEELMHG